METFSRWCVDAPINMKSKMYNIQQKIKWVKANLKNWNKEVFGNIFEYRKHLEVNFMEV